jgi:hypothetical protein
MLHHENAPAHTAISLMRHSQEQNGWHSPSPLLPGPCSLQLFLIPNDKTETQGKEI